MFTADEFKEMTFDQKKEVLSWRGKFHAKKAKATAEMQRIPKNGFNSFHNYYYARESDVKDSVREILRENQLSLTSDLVERVESVVKNSTKTDVVMNFMLTDCETGYFETYRLDGVALDNGDKGAYKAYTTTIKYFLMNEFLIPTGDDVEADAPMNEPRPQQSQQRPPQQQQRPPHRNQGSAPAETWKQIMNAEDRLAEVSGKTKFDVRNSVEHHFGRLPKYKELDEEKAIAILKMLKEWIAKYETPSKAAQ